MYYESLSKKNFDDIVKNQNFHCIVFFVFSLSLNVVLFQRKKCFVFFLNKFELSFILFELNFFSFEIKIVKKISTLID